VDAEFRSLLIGHEVVHARELGWETLSNGQLIAAAELEGFGAMMTVDKSLQHQQNLKGRSLSVIMLDTPRVTLPHIALLVGPISLALNSLQAGSFITIRSESS
jgi:hypothetical protein